MASIKGFHLNNVKTTLGIEGRGTIASMYFNGKKVGTYNDYGTGGCADISFVSAEAEEKVYKAMIAYAKERIVDEHCSFLVKLYEERPEQYQEACERFLKHHPYIPEGDITVKTMAFDSIECFVEDVRTLMEIEKIFKKQSKKGYKAIGVHDNEIVSYPDGMKDEEIQRHANSNDYTLYTSLDDFDIK